MDNGEEGNLLKKIVFDFSYESMNALTNKSQLFRISNQEFAEYPARTLIRRNSFIFRNSCMKQGEF